MFKKIQTDFMAAAFKFLRLMLVITIWSCHAFAAPAVRLCQGWLAALFGLQAIFLDRRRMVAIFSRSKEPNNLSLRGVKRRGNLKKSDVAIPFGLATTCLESDRVYINHPKLFQLRSRAARIASIPRIWGHGVKQPMGQAETPNPEPPTLNFKGFTLIELIVVIIIIGILAATVLPRIDFGTTSSRASVDGAAYMIASDIRYAQEFAMANRVSKGIVFTNGSSAYTFNPANAGMDPSGQLQSIGATIGTTVTFTFNSLGEPTAGGGSSVTVSAGGITKTITVTQYTGKASIS